MTKKKHEQDIAKLDGQLYSISYDADERSCQYAATLYGSPKLRLGAHALFALGMLFILGNMFFQLNELTILIFGMVFAVSGAVGAKNWQNVQAWALMGTNLGESKDDTKRTVVVCKDEIVIFGPAQSELHYPLRELYRLSIGDKGLLLSFKKARVAYIPSGILSLSRQKELERYLKSFAKHVQ